MNIQNCAFKNKNIKIKISMLYYFITLLYIKTQKTIKLVLGFLRRILRVKLVLTQYIDWDDEVYETCQQENVMNRHIFLTSDKYIVDWYDSE